MNAKYQELPDEEVLPELDASEQILQLTDELAEEIILENIEDQLENNIEPLKNRLNYVKLFKEKVKKIKEDGYYNKEAVQKIVNDISECVGEGLKKKYLVELGTDLDYTPAEEYLDEMETLYEFLFIRHFQNLIDYFKNELNINKQKFIEAYSILMDSEDESKDLFVIQTKKKFKNKSDVVIIHFMNEILNNIKSSTTSAYELFKEITELDIYEEYNNKMNELILNYGNKLVLNNDAEAARRYLAPLDSSEFFSEFRNTILISYLEDCELNQ